MSNIIDLNARPETDRGLILVVGFAFFGDEVMAIRHNKPGTELHGKLNGVGGKVNPGEHPKAAVAREFMEETGYDGDENWAPFCQMTHGPHLIYFFRCNLRRKFDPVQTSEGAVDWVPISEFNATNAKLGVIMPNLVWMIPMARQWNISALVSDTSLPFIAEALAETPR